MSKKIGFLKIATLKIQKLLKPLTKRVHLIFLAVHERFTKKENGFISLKNIVTYPIYKMEEIIVFCMDALEQNFESIRTILKKLGIAAGLEKTFFLFQKIFGFVTTGAFACSQKTASASQKILFTTFSFLHKIVLGITTSFMKLIMFTYNILRSFTQFVHKATVFTVTGTSTGVAALATKTASISLQFLQSIKKFFMAIINFVVTTIRSFTQFVHKATVFTATEISTGTTALATSTASTSQKFWRGITKSTKTFFKFCKKLALAFISFPVMITQELFQIISYLVKAPFKLGHKLGKSFLKFAQYVFKIIQTIHPSKIFANFLGRLEKPQFTFKCVGITFLYIMIILSLKYQFEPSNDPLVIPYPVSQAQEPHAAHINVGMNLLSFPTFSFQHNKFVFDATIWFQFERGSESIESINEFSLKNGNLMSKKGPRIKLEKDKVIASYHVQGSIKTPLNHRSFPFGDHKLAISIENKTVAPSEALFFGNDKSVTFDENLIIPGWCPEKSSVYTGAALPVSDEANANNYPVATFITDFKDCSIRYISGLYLPMLLIFLLGLLAFFAPILMAHKMYIIALTIPALGIFRMAIGRNLPDNNTFTHFDYTFFLLVFLALCILLFSSYATLQSHQTKSPEPFLGSANQVQHKGKLMFTFVLTMLILGFTLGFFI